MKRTMIAKVTTSGQVSLPARVLPALCLVAVMLIAPPSPRAETIAVKLVGQDLAKGLEFTTPVEDATFRIPLELEGGKGPIAVTIAVDDFIGPDARPIPVEATVETAPGTAVTARTPFELKQVDRPVLRIRGSFPSAGPYRSNVVLFYSETRQPSIALTVKRERNVVSVLIDQIDAVPAIAWRTADATIRFVVRENAGRNVTLDPPMLVQLSRKDGDRSPKQAIYDAAEFSLVEPGAKQGEEKLVPVTGPSMFAPQQNRKLQLALRGIADAGEYAGLIRVSNRESKEVERTFTVFVRESGWIAFFFIFLGVFASWAFRYWTREQRPKLETLRRISDLRDDLQGVERDALPTPPGGARVFTGLRDRLARCERDLSRGAKDLATRLDEIDRRISALPRWLDLGKRLSEVEQRVNVATIASEWSAIADTYFLRSAATEDAFNTSLAAVEKGLGEALKAGVNRHLEEIVKAVETYKATHSNEAAAMDSAVKPALDRARDDLAAGKLPEATEEIDAAKAGYTKHLVEALASILRGPEPLGLSAKEWQELGEELDRQLQQIRREVDVDRIIALSDAVNAKYLETVIAGAEKIAREQKARIPADSLLSSEVKITLNADLTQIFASIDSARTAVRNGDFSAAAADYEKAAIAIKAVADAIAKGGGSAMNITAAANAAAELFSYVSAALKIPAAATMPARPAAQRSTADRISNVIQRYDLLLNVAVLLIATGVGMKLLWASDPVWGGWTAYTIAFLWGLGLQQVGGATFEGLPAITKKLTE